MARTRTTKKLAQRIDLNYFKRATRFKRAKLWLSVLLPLLALGWIAWRGFSRDSRVYSSGRMTAAHAVLEQRCNACHLQQAGQFSSKASDSACEACHDGPAHQPNQIAAAVPPCATCHTEHRGRIQLSAASNQSCAECHSHLRVANGGVHYAAKILSLEDGHPEFAALRDGAQDHGTVKLNHAVHLKPIRQGPNGPIVQLECQDCHRNYRAPWKYAQTAIPDVPAYRSQQPAGNAKSGDAPRQYFRNLSGRERMRPVEFATACSACHLLTFDKRFDEGVPHDKPEVVHAFLVKKFQTYIATHPSEVRVPRDPDRTISGKPQQPEAQVLTAEQWVAERTRDAQELLWRKTCKQCHAMNYERGNSLPSIAAADMRPLWLPHSRFDHDAHRGFSCVGCHTKALTSIETSDILVPGIANCKTCHAPGPDHAESRCFECHTYHDWSKRKEVKANFTLPELQRFDSSKTAK